MTEETTYISSKGEEKDVTTLDASYLMNAFAKAVREKNHKKRHMSKKQLKRI